MLTYAFIKASPLLSPVDLILPSSLWCQKKKQLNLPIKAKLSPFGPCALSGLNIQSTQSHTWGKTDHLLLGQLPSSSSSQGGGVKRRFVNPQPLRARTSRMWCFSRVGQLGSIWRCGCPTWLFRHQPGSLCWSPWLCLRCQPEECSISNPLILAILPWKLVCLTDWVGQLSSMVLNTWNNYLRNKIGLFWPTIFKVSVYDW